MIIHPVLLRVLSDDKANAAAAGLMPFRLGVILRSVGF
jgi:hypothetical protein